MKNMTLFNIALACHGELYNASENYKNIEIDGVVIDSRLVEKNFLFIPIIGEKSDGHDFIENVINKGAICVLSMHVLDITSPYILVKDTKTALKDIAEFYRNSLDIKVIGITGSVGKTSTKEIIAAALGEQFNVLKTEANFNNEIGLPLTIFKIKPEHNIAVLEMGIDSFNEMHRLSKIARPDIVVMTNIGTCHLENLINRDGVLKAKSEIFDYQKENGFTVLNGDDDKLITLKDKKNINPIFFGVTTKQDAHADDIKDLGFDGTNVNLYYNDAFINVTIPIPGKFMVNNALAALVICKKLGMSLNEIKTGIESVKTISGRVNIIKTKQLTILDDCYNANPMSMKASIDILKSKKSEKNSRKVCILGDMFELGENEIELHKEVGLYLKASGIDLAICIGKLAHFIGEEAKEKVNVIMYDNIEEFIQSVSCVLKINDTIIVKASHGMNFVNIVDCLRNLHLEEK